MRQGISNWLLSRKPSGTDRDRKAVAETTPDPNGDDEPDARAPVKRLLEDGNGNVVTAGSAAEALELVRAERPDVLLCDIGVPGEDGYSLIKRVRALGPEQGGQLPSVALTAYSRAEDRVRAVRAVRAGFQTHLVKPVEPAELITMVASLAGRTSGR